MAELESLTNRLLTQRLAAYAGGRAARILEDPDRAWPQLSRSAMGVPRTLGIVLKQAWYRADSTGRTRIGQRDIDYGINYASKAYLNQMIGASRDGLAIPAYVPEIWEALLDRANAERQADRSSRASAAATSHFMVLPRNEARLKHLNMFFLVHLLTQGRTTKKESTARSLYSFDYGVAVENNLGWAEDKNVIRQHRFAYDDTLAEFDTYFGISQEVQYRCVDAGHSFAESDLQVGGVKLAFCPVDRSDLEPVDHAAESPYTEEEIKIIGAIRAASPDDRLSARRVADDVGCYVQKVAKFGSKLEREELISYAEDSDLARRIYFDRS